MHLLKNVHFVFIQPTLVFFIIAVIVVIIISVIIWLRLALGNQRFPAGVWLLAMCRDEFSAVIARLMSNCL